MSMSLSPSSSSSTINSCGALQLFRRALLEMDFPLLQITTTTVTKVVTNVKYEKMDNYQLKLLKCRGLLLFFSFP